MKKSATLDFASGDPAAGAAVSVGGMPVAGAGASLIEAKSASTVEVGRRESAIEAEAVASAMLSVILASASDSGADIGADENGPLGSAASTRGSPRRTAAFIGLAWVAVLG